MEWLGPWLGITFVFGLIYGSFLNVVMLRYDDWRSIVSTRSKCPNCKTTLAWFDLVPVLSFAFLGAKCRYCKKDISWRYPVVELITAVLMSVGYYFLIISPAATLFISMPIWQMVVIYAAFTLALGAMTAIFWRDFDEMMIPDFFSWVLIVTGLVISLTRDNNFLFTVYGGLIGFLPIALLVYPSKEKWMGAGDVKLSAGIGLMLGYPMAFISLVLAFLLGGVFGVVALGLKRVRPKTAVPFGPFLIIAGLITLFWGQQILAWYLGTVGYGYY